jgi:hypothetical protein
LGSGNPESSNISVCSGGLGGDSELGKGALAVEAAVLGCNFNEIRLIPGLRIPLVSRISRI